MIDILDELYSSSKCFSVETSEFIDAWRSIGRSVQDNPNIYMQVAESSLRNANAYEKIKTAVMGSVPKGLVYTEEKYRKDMDGLVEYIYAHVPPVEVANDESIDVTTTTGVLNAGWECFIRGLDDFKATLPNADRLTDHELNVSFNNFILKTMELGEVKRLWRESATDEMGEG